jgi:DNA-binding GntR family transcriptional regulator
MTARHLVVLAECPDRTKKASGKSAMKTIDGEHDIVGEIEPATTAVQRAANLIREGIVTGRFEPGIRLKVADLTESFDIGTMPVREALRKLEGEGLIEIEANRGATVRRLDRKFVQDIYELRAQVELYAIRHSIRYMTLAKLQRLNVIREKAETAVEAGHLGEFLQADKELHLSIFHIAGNQQAYRFSESTWDLIATLRARFGYQAGRLPQIVEEHRELVAAIGALDAAAAEQIAAMHSIAGLEDILDRMALAT